MPPCSPSRDPSIFNTICPPCSPLQDPRNKRNIIVDDTLKAFLKSPVNMFSMNKQLTSHIYKDDGAHTAYSLVTVCLVNAARLHPCCQLFSFFLQALTGQALESCNAAGELQCWRNNTLCAP